MPGSRFVQLDSPDLGGVHPSALSQGALRQRALLT
jgi:hypothetical protein